MQTIKWSQIRDDTIETQDIKDWTVRLVDLHPEVISLLWWGGWGWWGYYSHKVISIISNIPDWQQMIIYWEITIDSELQIDWELILEN